MDDDGSSSPASYIRLVQHLIEKCICYNMNKEECVVTLEKHANIMPIITSTVWKELEKENREFFETYKKDRGEEPTQKNPSEEQRPSASKSSHDDEDEEEEPSASKSSHGDDDDEEEEEEEPSVSKSSHDDDEEPSAASKSSHDEEEEEEGDE
ncbi:hypothetical protein BS78_03G329300 [Paspalum vaginatum]|nr:hypothetical protein BS78_03G329300 [Paspalum vaginatum]